MIAPNPPRPPLSSGPQIEVDHRPAGRDTLATFAAEAAGFVSGVQAPSPRPPESSAPEIQVTHGPAGRETLATFAAEATQLGARFENSRDMEGAPEIEIGQGEAGNATLAAIAADVSREATRIAIARGWQDDSTGAPADEQTTGVVLDAPRTPMRTLDYDEKPRGAASTTRGPLNTIETEAMADALGSGIRITEPPPELSSLEVFEMATYVVRGTDLARLASTESRRAFVELALLPRLPVSSMDQVDRIDVTPWTARNTVVVRVWCRVATVR